METVWTFKTANFRVTLELEQECGYQYDGDDEDGETQSRIDSGELVAFDSVVRVTDKRTGQTIGTDSLCGSVYTPGTVSEFWTAHRTSPAEYRNTLAQKAAKRAICHYFPGMVSEAIAEARKKIRAQHAARNMKRKA